MYSEDVEMALRMLGNEHSTGDPETDSSLRQIAAAALSGEDLMPLDVLAMRLDDMKITKLANILIRHRWPILQNADGPGVPRSAGEALIESTSMHNATHDHEALNSWGNVEKRQREAARMALTELVRTRPAVGRWDEALELRAPLVGARRGAHDRWFRYGLTMHRVAIKASWLVSLSAEMLTRDDPRAKIIQRWLTPARDALHQRLCSLPGVEAITSITPLMEPGNNRRINHTWVRVDSDLWPITATPEVTLRVDGPYGKAAQQ